MNILQLHNKIQATRRGYTLLFAVITAALVLGIGVFILGVSKKQYALSVTARESMYALYAADSAIECAAAALAHGDIASTSPTATIGCGNSSGSQSFVLNTSPDSTLWNGSTIEALRIPVLLKGTGQSFTSGGPCALVDVRYGLNKDDEQVLRIEARGYNQCVDGTTGPTPSSRTVERALRLTKKGV